MTRSSPLVLLAVAAAACGGGEETPAPRPPAASTLPLRLEAGLRLSLVPNLPGVPPEDVPEASRRDVEILAVEGRQLRLRWTGTVRKETAESAKRREEWVRAASNSPAGAAPLPTVPAAYEAHEIAGTLHFSDGTDAPTFLLPGLWPEGNVTLAGTSPLAIPRGALLDLKLRSEAKVPLLLAGKMLREPASLLLRRAAELASDRHTDGPDVWRRTAPARTFPLKVAGRPAEVPSVEASNWFGTFELLDDVENPLVLAVLPSPAPSPDLDLFAPSKVLKTLRGYRIAEVTPRSVALK